MEHYNTLSYTNTMIETCIKQKLTRKRVDGNVGIDLLIRTDRNKISILSG